MVRNISIVFALSLVVINLSGQAFASIANGAGKRSLQTAEATLQVAQLRPSNTIDFDKCLTLAYRKGIIVGERAGHLPGTGPTAWKQFMDACLSGKVH